MAAALAGVPATGAAQVPGETIEADVSAREIAIESTFTGVRIVVFGTVLHSRQAVDEPNIYDVAVVIRGPTEPIVVRRKSRVAGIWINTESQAFESVPGYYAVLSTRPLEQIADPGVLKSHAIGLDRLRLIPADPTTEVRGREKTFNEAVVRLKQREGLYRMDEGAVQFIGSRLFRAALDLPANVPIGEFMIDIYLFRDGVLLNQHLSRLVIHKKGFEEVVHMAAFDHPLIYGVAAVLIAIMAGLLASAIFRRD